MKETSDLMEEEIDRIKNIKINKLVFKINKSSNKFKALLKAIILLFIILFISLKNSFK